MKIEDIRLGMPMVSASGIPGTVVAISKEGGPWLETEDRTRFPVHVECVQHVGNPCEGCDAIKTVVDLSIALGKARRELDEMSDTLPYKQVEPEQLLLSDDAKIVCELLRSSGPASSFEISERLHMFERRVFESLIEAREAGIVRLDDGKYSIVRD
jgi:hypothetical protein